MRLLLVEDDPRLAAMICGGLAEDGLVVAHAESATVALNLAEAEAFDLLILDVMLPEGSEAGFALARAVRSRQDPTPILFLTARADMDSKVVGLDTGDDYLAKPFDFRELHARIRALVRRARGQPTNLVPLPTGAALDLAAQEVRQEGRPIKLTPREYALIACFALNPGRAYSRDALIGRVWPDGSEVDVKVVDLYVSTVRRKLGAGVIDTVRGTGYRLGRLGDVEQVGHGPTP